METALDLGRQAALDFENPEQAIWEPQQKIDLGSGRGSIKICFRAFRRCRHKVLDYKAFPTGACNRVSQNGLPVRKAQESVNEPAIPDIDPGRFDQPLIAVAVPWGEAPNEKQVDKQVQIVRNCLGCDAEAAAKFRGVQETGLVMGQHRPEPPKRFGGYARSHHGNVAFKIGSYEVLAPTLAGAIGVGQLTVRETSPDPQKFNIV